MLAIDREYFQGLTTGTAIPVDGGLPDAAPRQSKKIIPPFQDMT